MDFIVEHQQCFEKALSGLFNGIADHSTLVTAMQYACLNGGKRLRPLLVYATGLDFNGEQAKLEASALSVELIHCYSLIHDDLPAMDDDDMRRGQPSCHKKFNEATAILAGDALHALAFELLNKTPVSAADKIKLTDHLSAACGYQGMVGGQALELEFEGKKITVEDLTTIHLQKTAALIRASIELGAITSGVDNNTLAQLKPLGDTLGLAFQIQDDVFDFEEDSAANRPSFATLLGETEATTLYKQYYQQSIDQLNKLLSEKSELSGIISWLKNRDH